MGFFQFFPVAVFVFLTRQTGSWLMAFQAGGLIAIIQLAVLIRLKKPLYRLVWGANLFLILGGLGFYFKIDFITNALDRFRETSIICSVAIVTIIATLFFKSGVFENLYANEKKQRLYSCIFLIGIIPALYISYKFRGNIFRSGTGPFLYLILLKFVLTKMLTKPI